MMLCTGLMMPLLVPALVVTPSPFATRALTIVSKHPIVTRNDYTEWFANGDATVPQARDLVKQFSVFSNLFLLAQLNKVINAPTLDEMREGKEILANEIGVVFKPKKKRSKDVAGQYDPSIVSTSGTVEGGVYSNRAAHFEWLCDVGKGLGLRFDDLGKRKHGSEATLHFCDKLYEIYGSDDLSVSLGASFAIEHWANAGFWDDLVSGFTKLNNRPGPGVELDDGSISHTTPLGFWKFHSALEAQHAEHTMEELEEAYAAGRITDEAKFEAAANAMLDACGIFWAGLDADRKGEEFVMPKKSYTTYGI
jgi:pyrroloquinoline quinone (PQQ) biosynthesis protein C